jgi:uncharacterized Zn-binding protein involved in type VI secretion
MPNVIRLGEDTSHGGQVVSSGASHITVSGRPVALVGDKCACPINGHQNCTIVSGNAGHTVNGKAVAYDGDKTSCGASLILSISTFSST